MNLEQLKYPIGKYLRPNIITKEMISSWIEDISTLPTKLEGAVKNLSQEQLETPYRPDGWTLKQVVHHLADSHLNAFIRIKLALTEDQPTIKPYFEERWAELEDGKNMPIEASLKMISGIHARWTVLLKSLSDSDFERTFIHPEHGRIWRIDGVVGLYAWHGNHHLAHITETVNRNGW